MPTGCWLVAVVGRLGARLRLGPTLARVHDALHAATCVPARRSLLVAMLAGTVTTVGVGACFLNGGMYADPPAREPKNGRWVGRLSAAEEGSFHAREVADQDAQSHCDATIDSLARRGTVFVAEGERSPRAKELLSNECGPFTPEQRTHYAEPGVAKPLADANPALCDRLRLATPPEAFAVRYEGSRLYWNYFTYLEVGGQLRVLDLYSKAPVVVSERMGRCDLVAPDATDPADVGILPMWQSGGQSGWGPNLDTFDAERNAYHPDLVILSLVYTYHHPFRAQHVTVDFDGGR